MLFIYSRNIRARLLILHISSVMESCPVNQADNGHDQVYGPLGEVDRVKVCDVHSD